MTFEEWEDTHHEKLIKILNKLNNKSINEVQEYFLYDNMKVNEPDYCELYALNEICHDMDNLNCLFCACPYFIGSDTPLEIVNDIHIMSRCDINSRFRKVFTYFTKENEQFEQCDCSECHLPHKESFIKSFIKKNLV